MESNGGQTTRSVPWYERLRAWLPEGGNLPAQDWEARHRFILAIIAAHVVGLAAFGLVQGWRPVYALGEPLIIGLLGLIAYSRRLSPRFRSATAALALVTSSAVFVQFWGGFIEGHFHFFIVVAIVVLYQDWIPFLLAIAYVAIDHGVIGTLFPSWVYNHPDAIRYPWKWAAFHALLVLGECVALIYAWRFTERTRSQVDLLMTAAGEGILGLDGGGRIAFANPAATRMAGRPLEGLLNAPVSTILLDPAARPGDGLTTSWSDAHVSGDNLVVVRPDGTQLPVNWAYSPVREHDRVVGHVVTLMDATPHRQAEEERRKRLAQVNEMEHLKELNQFKTLFINTAAHELHTPLTPLRLNVFALKEGHKGELNSEQLEVVTVLERNVERLSLLVEDVLNAARLQANRLSIQKKGFDFVELAQETIASFQAQAKQSGVGLSLTAPPQIQVPGDRHRLTQVLTNLIDNALKFTPRGGSIVVELSAADGGLMVRVRDTGVGIAPKDHARLFQPFSQAHDHMAYTRSGSGLGLYICRGIIDLHGGRMGFTSEPGIGSTFWFALPRE